MQTTAWAVHSSDMSNVLGVLLRTSRSSRTWKLRYLHAGYWPEKTADTCAALGMGGCLDDRIFTAMRQVGIWSVGAGQCTDERHHPITPALEPAMTPKPS